MDMMVCMWVHVAHNLGKRERFELGVESALQRLRLIDLHSPFGWTMDRRVMRADPLIMCCSMRVHARALADWHCTDVVCLRTNKQK